VHARRDMDNVSGYTNTSGSASIRSLIDATRLRATRYIM
jgi:hypothetical protein